MLSYWRMAALLNLRKTLGKLVGPVVGLKSKFFVGVAGGGAEVPLRDLLMLSEFFPQPVKAAPLLQGPSGRGESLLVTSANFGEFFP